MDEMDKCYFCDKKIVKDEDKIDFDEEGNLYHSECFLEKRDIELYLTRGVQHHRVYFFDLDTLRDFFKASELILTTMYGRFSSISLEQLKKELKDIPEKEILKQIDYLKLIGFVLIEDDTLLFPFQNKWIYSIDLSFLKNTN